MSGAARRREGIRVGSFYRRRGKRVLDLVGASTALVVTSPVLLAGVITVRVTLGRPVLFRQVRPGLDSRLFTLLKLRTMREAADAKGASLPDAERLGRAGMVLRSTSIDELPTLINVIRGDMSLVGPRPLFADYLPLYSAEQLRRHEVRPGITGWAQVDGRNSLSWEEKFARDVWYVDHVSLRLDVRILLSTVATVLRRDGIAAEGHVTAPRFAPPGDGSSTLAS